MRRFRADRIGRSEIELDAATSHHLKHVLRIPPGTVVRLFDGRGAEVSAVVLDASTDTVRLRPCGPIERPRTTVSVTLLLAVSRGPAMDEAIRGATESGVNTIIPVRCRRSPPTADRHDRWLRKAEAAARQCGRPDLPLIHATSTLRDALADQSLGTLWFGDPSAKHRAIPGDAATLAVGPEGGWTGDERELLVSAGGRPCILGPWTLRVETAAAVGIAWLTTPTREHTHPE